MNSTKGEATLVGILLFLFFVFVKSQEPRSVCQTEQLDARCRSNDVVMMTSALYGRMRSGRCVDRNYGYLGCNASVLAQADALCSGRRSCAIAVPNAAFEAVVTAETQCPKDLKLYLEATYQCLPVVAANEKLCSLRNSALRLTSPSGFISNVYTEETELGSVKCPWVVQAGRRQRINVTLYDFATTAPASTGVAPSGGPGDPCHAYAIVRERVTSRAVTVCSGTERVRNVLLSEHDEIEVRIQTNLNRNRTKYFLLKYEFVGCPEPDMANGNEFVATWTPTRMEVGCRTSGRRWTLTCVGSRWSGENGNCSDPVGYVDMNSAKSNIPLGLSVIAVSLIALTLAAIILITGLMILRCHRGSRLSESLPDSVYYGETMKRHADIRVPASGELFHPEPVHRSNTENEYSYIGDTTDSSSVPGGGARRSHDYGTTTEVRSDTTTTVNQSPCSAGEVEKRNGLRPSGYFELEPNGGVQKRSPVGSEGQTPGGFERCFRQAPLVATAVFVDGVYNAFEVSAAGVAGCRPAMGYGPTNDSTKHLAENYRSV